MALELETLLDPIPGDDPGGTEVRYEPVFLKLKEARTEEEDLPTGDWSRERKEADWGEAIKLASTILREHAKDLQTAVWLAEALLRKEGPGGLAQGLRALARLVDEHWDHLHPRIEDADDVEFRASPLDWLGSYLVPAVRLLPVDGEGHTLTDRRAAREVGYEADLTGMESREARNEKLAEGKPAPESLDAAFEQTPKAWYRASAEALEETLNALAELERVSDERFGADAPRLSPLRDALDEVRRDLVASLEKKLETDPDPVEPDPLPEFSVEGGGEGSAEGPGAPGDPGLSHPAASGAGAGTGMGHAGGGASPGAAPAPGSREEAEARVGAAARFLRRQDPTDPAPYLLLRGFRWGELRKDPERVDPRLLAPPPTDLRTRLRTLLLDGAWAPLLEAAEEVMATPFGRGWLDLQRYVLEACEGLGSPYDPVARAVRGALGELLRDLPSLVDQTLLDDTPTANTETRAWLASSGLLGGGEEGGTATPSVPLRGGRDPWTLARQRMEAGKPEEAVQLLVARAEQERSARDRFLRRTQAASIMVEMGRAPVARPILEELAQEIEEHTLETYEAGETVAEPLSLLYRALLQMGESGHQVEELYLRICRLDPMGAIRLPRPDDE